MTDTAVRENGPWLKAAVILLRIAVGLVFVSSGLAKTIDLWGTLYKMEEYLKVWHMLQPRSIVLMGAMALSGAEFVLGVLLTFGCYRRTSVWLLLAMMAGMLPLSLYIYLANPVSDCGCFGDLIHLSNSATFWKNIAITAALIWLAIYNRRIRPLFSPWIQWVVVALSVAYALIIGLYGYNVQPMVDFRSFPIGSELVRSDADLTTMCASFIYEKDDKRQVFDMDDLPDSTWTYVDRADDNTQAPAYTEMAVYNEYGDEVTLDALPTTGHTIILVIPEMSRAVISYTYFLNELNDKLTASDGELLALVAGSATEIKAWRDMSMAVYPVYAAESTLLKELARGSMALVAMTDGRIDWKVNLSAVDTDKFISTFSPDSATYSIASNGSSLLRSLTLMYVLFLVALYILDSTGRLLKWRLKRRHASKSIGETRNND